MIDRYRVVKARPDGDPLGDADRLIVDDETGTVVAIVYSSALAGVAAASFDALADPDVQEELARLEAEPLQFTFKHGPHRLQVDGEALLGVAFAIDSGDTGVMVQVPRVQVEELHQMLSRWLDRQH